jgi:D-alanine-D-alanine ligase-like ATP-grasp enzyme/acylphosphatase
MSTTIERIQILTLQGEVPVDLLKAAGATDPRGLLCLVRVVDGDRGASGFAVGEIETGHGARDATWDVARNAAARLAGLVLGATPDDVDAEIDGAVAAAFARARERAPVGVEHLTYTGVEGGVALSIRRAAHTLLGGSGAGPDLTQLLADVVGETNRYAALPSPPSVTFEGRPSNTYPELTYLRPLGVNGTKGHLLERQALTRGFDTLRFTKGAFIAWRDEGPDLPFKWSRSPLSSGVSLSLCNHKEATRIQLRRNDIPAPRGRMFVRGDYEAARSYAKHIGYPVVCKPAAGVRGIGVVAGIQDEHELEQAFIAYQESRLGGDDFIVEEHIDGGDYRIVVVEDEVAAAILREPASVLGDGRHTIAELVLQKNELRRQNPHLWGRLIKIDARAVARLKRQGFDLTSVPSAGVQVRLSDTCSLSQGGDSIDILDELHPSIRDAAVAAVKAIPGLRYCGVDFLLHDHRLPLDEQRSAGICELNAHAAIGNGEYPMFGTPREVASRLFSACAADAGYEPRDVDDTLNVQLEIRGKVTRVRYREWFAEHARLFGLTGWIENQGKRRVIARIQGPAYPVSALASVAVLGPRRALPTTVRTTHVNEPLASDFEVR